MYWSPVRFVCIAVRVMLYGVRKIWQKFSVLRYRGDAVWDIRASAFALPIMKMSLAVTDAPVPPLPTPRVTVRVVVDGL